MIYLGVAAFVIFCLFLWVIKHETAAREREKINRENAEKALHITKKQNDIAARPHVDLATLLKRMRSKGGL